MKKFILFALALTMMMPCTVNAQSERKVKKERREMVKQCKRELNARVTHATQKGVRKLKKVTNLPLISAVR